VTPLALDTPLRDTYADGGLEALLRLLGEQGDLDPSDAKREAFNRGHEAGHEDGYSDGEDEGGAAAQAEAEVRVKEILSDDDTDDKAKLAALAKWAADGGF
jgi:hypothetical protein